MTLSDSNQRWHQSLDRSFQQLLEALTSLDFPQVHTHWAQFQHSLLDHIEFEQNNIEPLTEAWDSNTLKLIQSDHLILKRLLPRLDLAINEIVSAHQPRTVLVHKLGDFIKMRNVLEHHDSRESEHLYPRIDKQLEEAKRNTLVKAMEAKFNTLP